MFTRHPFLPTCFVFLKSSVETLFKHILMCKTYKGRLFCDKAYTYINIFGCMYKIADSQPVLTYRNSDFI